MGQPEDAKTFCETKYKIHKNNFHYEACHSMVNYKVKTHFCMEVSKLKFKIYTHFFHLRQNWLARTIVNCEFYFLGIKMYNLYPKI